MKDQRKTEIKVGIIVIIAILIFLWILGWAKNFSLVSNEKLTTLVFKNVAGLEAGDNVTVNGVREGYVKEISVKGDDVFVTISLNKEVMLKKDASFSVAMLDVMGGKKIEVRPGISNENFEYDKIHQGSFYADIPYVMSMVGNMQGDISESLKDIKVTLKSLNNYLTDEQLNKNIKSAVSNFNKATEKLDLILSENRTAINQLITNSNTLAQDTKKLISENKDNISSSLENLKSVLQKTDTLLTTVNSFALQTTEKKNNFGKILYDKEFFDKLNNSLKQVNDLTKLLIQQLKDKGIKVNAYLNIF